MVGFRSHRPLTRVVEYVGVLLEVSMLPPCSKLVWPRDWSGKQKASSPPDVPPPPQGGPCNIAATHANCWREEVEGQGGCEASVHLQKQGALKAWLTSGEAGPRN